MKMKRLVLGICLSISVSSAFANVFPVSLNTSATNNCGVASDITSSFCSQFKTAVTQCTPQTQHMSMQAIYVGMVALYGGLKNACAKAAQQHGGTVQGCIGQWTCYWYGGSSTDMQGLCDGNGQKCGTL